MASAPNSMSNTLAQAAVTSTSTATSPSSKQHQAACSRPHIDLIVESKFNELAKKIFDELQQVHYSNQFLRAIDGIIKEPIERSPKFVATSAKLDRAQAPGQTLDVGLVSRRRTSDSANHGAGNCKSSDNLAAQSPSEQQQHHHPARGSNSRNDQSSHLARLAGQKIQQEASSSLKQSSRVSSAQFKTSQQQAVCQQLSRSAIPTSTVLSGINVAYPISKSASVGGSSPSKKEVKSATSPSKTTATSTTHSNQDNKIVKSASHQNHSKLTPSEKLHQRRPTRATLDANDIEFLKGNTKKSLERLDNGDADDDYDINDDEDDDDDDDDDDNFGASNLIARRDYLNQKFIQQTSNSPIAKSRTFSDATSFSAALAANTGAQQVAAAADATRASISQTMDSRQHVANKGPDRDAPMARSSSTSTTQPGGEAPRRRHNPIVRSSTIGGSSNHSGRDRSQAMRAATQVSQGVTPAAKSPLLGSASRSNNIDNNNARQSQQASFSTDSREPRSIEILTSRDIGHLYKPHMNYSTSVLGTHRLSDDDEIIIIPTQSPSLLSGTTTPDNNTSEQQQHNMDELSERFSISRTKSFWEKLSNTKNVGANNNNNNQITNNTTGPNPGLVGANNRSKSPAAACNDQQQQQFATRLVATAHQLNGPDNKLSGLARQQQRQNFDRMDSTGGSNSYYSNCSSSSGDELNPVGLLQSRRDLQHQQQPFANKNNATGATTDNISANNNCLRQHQHRSINNPTISQLQQEMSRQNILRQTR